ncbi:MAG: hypothetical protein EBS76_01265 [Actinobacteria bacterium]|nr:hypothetical protein [Actinomycetota bacterium]
MDGVIVPLANVAVKYTLIWSSVNWTFTAFDPVLSPDGTNLQPAPTVVSINAMFSSITSTVTDPASPTS